MRTDILDRKDEILQWISEERPKSYISQQLRCKPETLNSYLQLMGIEYAGQQNKKGQFKGSNVYKPSSYYFDNQHPIKSSLLKEKLFKDGLKEKKCELCGLELWLNQEIPLELHHKNNNHNDNSFDNLQILCPNCHALQAGNSGANIGAYIAKTESKKYYCADCGAEITRNATTQRCVKCAQKAQQIVERPNREELKNLIRTMPFTQIAKIYGVSDNAIRKWCIAENLPSKATQIKSMSKEEWDLI